MHVAPASQWESDLEFGTLGGGNHLSSFGFLVFLSPYRENIQLIKWTQKNKHLDTGKGIYHWQVLLTHHGGVLNAK